MLVFISYAHGDVDPSSDRDWLGRIDTYFRPEVRRGSIELWWDEAIEPGQTWESEIRSRVDAAGAAILLVSPRFLASDYIFEKEMPRLLERRREGGLELLPLILETCEIDTPFRYPDPQSGPHELSISSLQGANDPSEPLVAVQDDDAISQVLKRLLARVRTLAGDGAATQPKPGPRRAGLRVLVAGSGIPGEVDERQAGLAHALGVELAAKGYGLVSGGWEGVDAIVTAAFLDEHARRDPSSPPPLVQVVQRGWNPPHRAGEMLFVDPGDSEWIEQIVRSDAIVLIGGLGGTWTTGELGYLYGKPVLALADTGGDARAFHDHALRRWDSYPMRKLTRDDFARLTRPAPAVLDDVMEILGRL